jgi:ACT domain-containing protein
MVDQHGRLDPELVPVGGPSGPPGAVLIRLRLPDRPGSLARVAERFAARRVDVLRLEVVGREGGWAIDDFLVTGADLPEALAELGPDISVLARRQDVDLPDPGLAMAAACAAVTSADSKRRMYRRLLEAALGLVFAEAGFVCVRQPHGFLRPVASTVADLPVIDGGASLLVSALHSGECLTADGRAPWVPPAYLACLPRGSVAAVPGGAPAFFVLALVRRDHAPFVEAELARLAALLSVADGTLQLHELNVALARRGRPGAGWLPQRA